MAFFTNKLSPKHKKPPPLCLRQGLITWLSHHHSIAGYSLSSGFCPLLHPAQNGTSSPLSGGLMLARYSCVV
jgi:hypothetical protein